VTDFCFLIQFVVAVVVFSSQIPKPAKLSYLDLLLPRRVSGIFVLPLSDCTIILLRVVLEVLHISPTLPPLVTIDPVDSTGAPVWFNPHTAGIIKGDYNRMDGKFVLISCVALGISRFFVLTNNFLIVDFR